MINSIFPKISISKRFSACILLLLIVQLLKSQTPNIVLGRPTDSAVTASVMFDAAVNFYLEYGFTPGSYTQSTSPVSVAAGTPAEVDMTGLKPNQRHYYRVRYKAGGTTYSASPEYNFHTQRSAGSTFTFTIEADEHLYDKKGIANMYRVTLANQAADKPDFMLSLGDIFGDDHTWQTITSPEVDALHKDYRPFLGAITHSIPFYVCLGNHEGENDYYYNQNPGSNLTVWGTQWRKFYYPNPFPNRFYSGNNDIEDYGIGNPENYYEWTWGDAHFIVLDAYRDQCDTSDKPIKWAWTLGKKQYDWLKTTLESSKSKYKFVFAHHVRGQGRGGVTNAPLYEWGGLVNGRDLFAANRPGWAAPIHKLFVDNKVNIFFQGHDHVFAHEMLDGITYQTCPMPSDSTYRIGMDANADAFVSDTIEGTGHIRVTVGPNGTKVDFVRAYLPKDTFGIHKNREVPFSYVVGGNPAGARHFGQQSVRLYPNPATDRVNVLFAEHCRLKQIRVYSMSGQLLVSARGDYFMTENLKPGVYAVEVTTEHQRILEKLIVNER